MSAVQIKKQIFGCEKLEQIDLERHIEVHTRERLYFCIIYFRVRLLLMLYKEYIHYYLCLNNYYLYFNNYYLYLNIYWILTPFGIFGKDLFNLQIYFKLFSSISQNNGNNYFIVCYDIAICLLNYKTPNGII